jgi:hypothetical protein
MTLQVHAIVTLPGFQPYPRYGRIAKHVDAEHVRVTNVQCGDPRCAAEHQHGDVLWATAELEAAQAYQPRAPWEHGRKSSPNATVGS